MHQRHTHQLAAIVWYWAAGSLLICAAAAHGEEPAGKLEIFGRSYALKHVAAFEAQSSDEPIWMVVASDRAIPVAQIKRTLQENDGDGDSVSLNQPYVRFTYLRSGEIQYCQAWAENASFGTGGESLTGTIRVEGERARGRGVVAATGEGNDRRSVVLEFDIPLGLRAAAKPRRTGPVAAKVTGRFTGNGRPAKLAFVSARWREPFNDRAAIDLIFTEKDPARESKPEIAAVFGKFGSALVLSVNEDGGIFGCEVAHAAHEKKPFTSLGRIRTAEFEMGEGYVQGIITTDGETDTFDQKWDVELTFEAPLAAQPESARVAQSDEPAEDDSPMTDEPDDESAEKSNVGASLKARELPFPEGAGGFQFKELVEQIVFKCPGKVQAVAKDFTRRLKAAGWEGGDGDLITPQSAILNFEQGDASLTVMIKPSGGGSQVTMFTEELDWEE